MKKTKMIAFYKTLPIISLPFLIACSSPAKDAEKVTDDSEQIIEETIQSPTEVDALKETTDLAIEALETVEKDTLEIDATKVVEIDNRTKAEIEKQVQSEIKVIEDLESDKTVAGVTHSVWDELLQKYVSSSGKVNYKGFKSDKVKLERYLTLLKNNSPTSDWSRNEKLAYWINVYNAFTVKLIVDNYPLKSIMDLDKPWDKKWINIEGKSYSLGNVENDILRKMGESRIHFAINCASFSCPNLLNEAYTADQLSSQLRKVTKDFFNDKSKNDLTDGDLKVSKLFEWYAADFYNGDIVKYVNKYSGKEVSPYSKVSFLEYSWKLNE